MPRLLPTILPTILRTSLPTTLPLTLLALATAAASTVLPALDVDTTPAVLDLDERPDERRLLRLPALEFGLRMTPRCAAGTAAAIAVSVADTRLKLTGDEVVNGHLIEAELVVPGAQLPPLLVEGFCTTESSGDDSRLIEGVLTAQLSLRCTDGDRQTVYYQSKNLNLRLNCRGERGAVALIAPIVP